MNDYDFSITPGTFGTSLSGSTDAFVAKLEPDGSTLAYATYLGGSDNDAGYGIALDGAGSAYVMGPTHSTDFPTTPEAFDRSHNGGYSDAFVVKLAMGSQISGRVTDASGHGISGVTVWAGFPRNTTTDANGNYTFTGLPAA